MWYAVMCSWSYFVWPDWEIKLDQVKIGIWLWENDVSSGLTLISHFSGFRQKERSIVFNCRHYIQVTITYKWPPFLLMCHHLSSCLPTASLCRILILNSRYYILCILITYTMFYHLITWVGIEVDGYLLCQQSLNPLVDLTFHGNSLPLDSNLPCKAMAHINKLTSHWLRLQELIGKIDC